MAKRKTKDYTNYLVLYSGGADSTHFIEQESTAKHLIHYRGLNDQQTKAATINANILNRYITVETLSIAGPGRDGETNQIHALYDTHMAIDAGIRAVSHGMRGLVMCFNADDIAIDVEAVNQIFRRVEPEFELILPLRDRSAKEIREALKSSKAQLHYVSCMHSERCGFCAKCRKGY